MPNTCPSGSLPTVGRVWALPFSHNTGNRIRLLVVLGGHVESTIPFSANPAICPWLLIAVASPLFPPIVGRALMWPFCQTNGRHVSPVPKPHKSSPFGSETAVSAKPTATPRSLIPSHQIQLFVPPRVPRSILSPSMSTTARPFRSFPDSAPAIVPIHDLRPALIIDGHGTNCVVPIVQNAQIGNRVVRLSKRIAEASENNRRNPRYPEIPQPSQCTHIFSFSSESLVPSIFRQNAPAVPATRLSLANESRGCIRVGCCCAMRQAESRL